MTYEWLWLIRLSTMSLLIAAQIRDCSDQKHAITNREFVIHDYKSTRDCSPHIKNPAFVIRYIHVVKKVKSRPKNHPGNHPEWLPLKSHLSKGPRSCSRSRAPPQGWLLLGSHPGWFRRATTPHQSWINRSQHTAQSRIRHRCCRCNHEYNILI